MQQEPSALLEGSVGKTLDIWWLQGQAISCNDNHTHSLIRLDSETASIVWTLIASILNR